MLQILNAGEFADVGFKQEWNSDPQLMGVYYGFDLTDQRAGYKEFSTVASVNLMLAFFQGTLSDYLTGKFVNIGC